MFAQQQGWLFQENYGRPTVSTHAVRSATPSYAMTAPVVAPVKTGSIEIDLQVPTDAKVYFNGAATTQTGMSRAFVTAPLTPGYEYSYAIRVQWHEGNRLVERTRDLSFMAGDHVRVDFTQPS